jgi:phosphoserine phosphatase RsbU/P
MDPSSQQLTDLNALLAISRELGATTEFIPLLDKVEKAVLQVLDCDRSAVFLHDRTRDELFSLVATGGKEIRFPASLGIAGEALQSRRVINVPDAYDDARFNREVDKQTGYRTRSVLTFPMAGHDGTVVGVLQALNKQSGVFDETDEDRAELLASLAGIAIQRQMLLDEYAEKQQLERDLSLARDIQQDLLPKSDPDVPGYAIAGWNKPADATGGDCYDYVRFADGKLGVLLADATGHGIGPALIVSQCRAIIHALALDSDDPAHVLQRTNRIVEADLSGELFVTVFLGILNPSDHKMQFLSAGQGPLLHYHRESGTCSEIGASTYPVGILPDLKHKPVDPIIFATGDILILVTDGFFEWANEQKEQFGTDRLADVVHTHRDESPARIIELLYEAVRTFAGSTPQDDDLTAVIVKRL